MATSEPRRTLIVANLTASTPSLLQKVERRADEALTTFSLLIPERRLEEDHGLDARDGDQGAR